MKYRLSCSTVVISLLVIILPSINVDALRGSTSPVDDQRQSPTRSRGSSRFSQSPTTEDVISSFPSPASGTISRRAGSPARRSSKLGSSLESSPKVTLVDRKLTGRGHSAVADPVESIKPEDSVLEDALAGKNTARRNTQSLKDGVPTRRSDDRSYLPERTTRVRTQKSFSELDLEAPKETIGQVIERKVSRLRIEPSKDEKILAQTGPSVFSGNVQYSRSRTGRKIQNPSLAKESENTRPDSRRWESRTGNSKSRNNARNFDTTAIPQSLDTTSTEIESVRVDIPLTIPRSENIQVTEITTDNSEATSAPPATRGRGRGGSRQSLSSGQQSVRARSESSAVNAARSNERRGGSRFSELETETSSPGRTRGSSDRGVESRSRNAASRSQASETSEASENVHKSRGGRGRGKKTDDAQEIGRDSKDHISLKTEPERHGRVSEARSRPRNSGSASRDERRSPSRLPGKSSDLIDSRSRPETPSATAATTPAALQSEIATVAPDAVANISEAESTVLPELETATMATTPTAEIFAKVESTTKIIEMNSEARNSRGKTRGNDSGDRRASRQRNSSTSEASVAKKREFRGRDRSAANTSATESKESHLSNQRRRTHASTPREDIRVAKTAPSASASPEDAMIGSTEIPSRNIRIDGTTIQKSAEIDKSEIGSSTTSTTPSANSVPRRRGMKRLNIRPKDVKEELSTASSIKSSETLNENGRIKGGRRGEAKSIRKSEISDAEKPVNEITEEDNYPADFKARLALLKNSGSKVPPAIKSTTRIGSPNFKKPSPVLFSTNGRFKLEKNKKVNNPTDNVEENELAVEQTSVSPSTTQEPQSLPTRKSLFGKRPKPAPSTGPNILENDRSTTSESPTVEARIGSRPSFGKIRRTEKPVITAVRNENVKTLQMNDAPARTSENFKIRAIKQRPSFAKRRSAPTTETTAGIDTKVTSTTPATVTTFKPFRLNGNSVSKYVSGSRTSPTGERTGNQSGKLTKLDASPSEKAVVKRINERSTDLPNALRSDPEITTSNPSGRYTRRKSDPKAFRRFDAVPKSSGEPETSVPAKREFRPRTATYRRHSEAPPAPITLPNSSNISEPISIAITPKAPEFHSSIKAAGSLSGRNAKNVNVQISENSPNGDNDSNTGIFGSSNGESGKGVTNVFNPTKTVFLINRNASLLEQLRSTVAPLLSSLGLKSPVFAGSYRNTTSSGNSAIRVTPSGQPPRFSARYKGAELFVRRPNIYQPTVPSVDSSTTPLTPLKVFGVSSPLDVSSPGEPEVLTYYQALETASINNEQQTDVQQPASVGQVDNDNDNDTDKDINDTNNANNDINTVPALVPRFGETETNLNTSENTIITEPDITQNPETTTAASLDISSQTTPSTAQDASLESTTNSQTTAETVTESIQTMTTSPVPSQTTLQSFDISSTTLVTDTSSNPTPISDTTVAPDVEETSSPQDNENLARLLDTTTVSLASVSGILENFETSTSLASTVTQERSSESSQANTTPGNGDLFPMSAASPGDQTTQISETTAMAFLRVEMQPDADSSTSSAESSLVDAGTTPDSLDVDPTAEISATTTPVVSTPQTAPSILARFSDSETSDVTTVASPNQEPTTLSSLEVTTLTGVTAGASQVTNQLETEVATQIIPANSQTEFLELNIATELSTQTPGQSDATTTTPATTQNVRESVEHSAESTGGSTESDMSSITTSTEILSTTPESGNSLLSTITVEPRFENTEMTTESLPPSTTVSFEVRFGIISSDTASTTAEPSPARIVEPLDTLTTEAVASETTTIMPGEEMSENTTPQTTTEMNSVNSSQLLAAFVENTVSTEMPATTTQTTQNTFSPETTTPFDSLSGTTTELETISTTQNNPGAAVDSFDISARLVEIGTTQDPTLTTNSILTTEITRESDGASTQNPGDTEGNGTTELTTSLPTVNEITTDSMPETSTTPEPTTLNPHLITDTPTLLARLQDITATTTASVTAQGTAGVDVQATTRPNETSEIPETTSSSPITQSFTTTPASQASNEISTTDTNIPESTTTAILPDSTESPTTLAPQMSADLMATTEQIPAMSTVPASAAEVPTTSTPAPETTPAPTMAATTASVPETTFGIDENLISADPETTSVSNDVVTEVVAATTDAMQHSIEINEPPTTSSPAPTTTEARPTATSSSAEMTTSASSTTLPPPVPTTAAQLSTTPQILSTAEAVVISDRMSQGIQGNTPQPRENLIPTTAFSFPSRFGASRLTPAPRFSSSSSTQAPLRDYHVYGIYPNKTIVRKRPEDNLIDGRNVNSPYVIFGIYPNGKLVRKFPNGTVIPDPPRNPVEVVFSLSTSTTTTNRPGPVFYNQANPGYNYNQISPNYNNRPVPSIFNQNTNRFDAANFGFTGNAIAGSTGGVSGLSSVGIANKKMSDVLLGTQMGTNSNTASEIFDLLTTSPNRNTAGSTPTPARGQISQERESDEASRSRDTNGQRSSVYIGQEKFINYWSDSTPNTSPRVVSVRINSVASSSNVGPASAIGSSLPSLDILPGSQSGNPVTTAPGFPWNDPLDQIFGITTNAPVVTASVATNTLPDTFGRTTILPRPINPFVEVFTPVSSSIDTTVTGPTASTPIPFALMESPTASTPTRTTTTTTTTTTPEPTTTTTTATTTATTTTTPAPTPTTPTTAPTTLPPTTTTTTTPSPPEVTSTRGATLQNFENLPRPQAGFPQEAPFGNTFNDLAFLNALLQPADSGSSTQKTLSQAEQYLADKILSLALGNAGPTRSPKAIQPSNDSPNLFDLSIGSKSQTKPIIIDLLSSSTTRKPSPTQATTQFTWKPVPIVKTTSKPPTTTQRPTQATWKPIPIVQTTTKATTISVTTPVTTTGKPVQSSLKPTAPPTTTSTTPRSKPRTTVAPPNQGFAAGLLTALFGSNPFAPAPTPAPPAAKKPAVTTLKSIGTTETRRPVSTTQKPVQQTTAPKLLVTKDSPSAGDSRITATTEQPVTNGIAVLLNNPNPRVPTLPSSTFSPADDAKFLAALLNSASATGTGSSQKSSKDISDADQALLRAILNNSDPRAPNARSSTPSPGGVDGKFLAALLNSASQTGGSARQKTAPKTSAVDEVLLKTILNNANPATPVVSTSTFSPEDDAKFLAAVLKSASQPGSGTSRKTTPGVSADDEAFLRAILSGQASLEPASPVAAGTSGGNDAALLAALLKAQGIGPSTPTNNLRQQLSSMTTKRPASTTWTPSSTYPPSIFDAFSNFGGEQAPRDDRMIANAGDDTVRSQVVGAAIGATKAFSRFLGQAITGAAQQFQSFVRNGSKYVSEAVAG